MMLGSRPMCKTSFKFLHTFLLLYTKNYNKVFNKVLKLILLQNIHGVAINSHMLEYQLRVTLVVSITVFWSTKIIFFSFIVFVSVNTN